MKFTGDHRLITLSLPLARAVLARRVRQLRRKSPPKGVQRLDAVFVINLARRTDRLTRFEAEMQSLKVDGYLRFEAIEDDFGILGCTRSHAGVLRSMLGRSWSCIMICEDDAEFLVSRDELDVLVDAFLDDDDAEVACLAYHHLRRPARHNALFVRAPEPTTTAACYLVKRSIAADLLNCYDTGARELANGGDRMVFGNDAIWSRLQRTRVFLIPIKRAVRQASGYSDVERAVVDYGGL